MNFNLNISNYLLLISIIFLIATIALLFVREDPDVAVLIKREENKKNNIEEEGIKETFSKIIKMFKNSYLREFLLIILISDIGCIFYDRIIQLVFLEKGISQQILTNISTVLVPVEVAICFTLSDIKVDFIKKYLFGYKYLIFFYFMQLAFVVLFEDFNSAFGDYLTYAAIFTLSFVRCIFDLIVHAAISGFFHRISDREIGATYITALNSTNNLAQKWPTVFVFALVDYFGYKLIGSLSIVYSGWYFFTYKNRLLKFETVDDSCWKIKNEEIVKDS